VAASNFPPSNGAPKLLANKNKIGSLPTVYVCEGHICKQPVTTLVDLKKLLGKK
jgi:uncharacterized protein YyaL (SSP411 family)